MRKRIADLPKMPAGMGDNMQISEKFLLGLLDQIDALEQPRRYFFSQDDSGHWYLVEEDHREEWEQWCGSQDEADGVEFMFAIRVNGPVQAISFAFPEGDPLKGIEKVLR